MKDTDKLYTPAAVARLLGVSRQSVLNRATAGRLAMVTIAGVRFVHLREITKWRNERLARAAVLSNSQLPTPATRDK